MVKIKKLKKMVGHESNIARCKTCMHYIPPKRFLMNSLPRKSNAMCGLYHFTTTETSLCNFWQDRAGDTLSSVNVEK